MARQHGFTLIELMIVVAVLAIIAAIAFPSYLEFVKEGRRAEAVNGVGKLQMAQERWRAEHTTYGSLSDLTNVEPNPTSDYYTFEVSGNTGSAYTITATPKGKMAGDSCGVLTATAGAAGKPTFAGGGSCNK